MQPAPGGAGVGFIRYVTGPAGEPKIAVAAGDALPVAFTVFQIAVLGTSLRDAFAADQFERIILTGHRDPSVAKACSGNGQLPALAIRRVGSDAGPARRHGAAGRHQVVAGRTGALSVGQGAAVADDGIAGLANGFEIGEAISAFRVQMGIGRTRALP